MENIKTSNSTEKKRMRNESSNFIQHKPQCVPGKSPNFHLDREITSDITFGTNVETNEHRIESRMKQIQFGKNTIGYDNYLAAVPKNKRGKYAIHPRTPDPKEDVSKRAFDGRIKAWRRELHKWDNAELTLALGVNTPQIQPTLPAGHVKPLFSDSGDLNLASVVTIGTSNPFSKSSSATAAVTDAVKANNGSVAAGRNSKQGDTLSTSVKTDGDADDDSEAEEAKKLNKFSFGEGEDDDEKYVEEFGDDEDVL